MREPPLRLFDHRSSHRLIPARYSEPEQGISALAGSQPEVEQLARLEQATSATTQGEEGGLIGISTYELVYGIPHAPILNATFTNPGESGSRFNDHTRGAWYAANLLQASAAEVAYHRGRRLAEVIIPGEPYQRLPQNVSSYDDWQANFRSLFHILDPAADFAAYLQPEPVPECYAPSQAFARHLLKKGSNGVVYPGVRYPGSTCIACFRPALIYHPRQAKRYTLTLKATPQGYRHSLSPLSS